MSARTDWTNSILDILSRVDQACVQYLRSRRTKIGFSQQSAATGAIWFVDGNILPELALL